jgi:hypothetical protein
MRRTFIVAAMAALVFGSFGTRAQTPAPAPINAFAEVAGKWTGVGSRGQPSYLEIQPNGNFVFDTALGVFTGVASLDGGMLVLPFSDNKGQQKFGKAGDALEGPYVYETRKGTTRMTRKAQ